MSSHAGLSQSSFFFKKTSNGEDLLLLNPFPLSDGDDEDDMILLFGFV